jgi:hypothetical protein
MHQLVVLALVGIVELCLLTGAAPAWAQGTAGSADAMTAPATTPGVASLDAALHLFYSGRYEEAAAMALQLRTGSPEDLATYELRTSALHFQIKRAVNDAEDKDAALKACDVCPRLLEEMKADTAAGQQIAHARLKQNEDDTAARFLLGKIDLNHVWLHLGTLGQRTGWGEYWEARHSLDKVLDKHPDHVRARVARAWIDYIVDTRVPRGLRWILGGGSKKKALIVAHEAAIANTDYYSHTEANFALWEMLVREKNLVEARTVAVRLAAQFPTNRELIKFLAEHPEPGDAPTPAGTRGSTAPK